MQNLREAVVGLQATIRNSGDVAILDLKGRALVGPENDRLASELQQLIQSGPRKLLVNLAGLTQVDSSGVSTLVRAFVSLRQSGGSLKLLGAGGRVLEVLAMTRLLDAIPNFDDEAAALASFR